MTDKQLLAALRARNDAAIFAKDIAPILHTHESQIRHMAKNGEWDEERDGEFILIGNRIKFKRADFVKKWSERV